jgi:glycosyltransferase involved in cell wall biosynthesis
VAVLIPARDEAGYLPQLVKQLRHAGVPRVLVVDNGSTDGTGALARAAGAEVIEVPIPGYGRACLEGLRHLRAPPGRGEVDPPEVVVFMDGDGSDDPADLDCLVGPVCRGEADLVLGARSGSGDREPGKRRARWGTRVILWCARWMNGLEAQDLGPFRAVRWDLLESLEMDDTTWGWTLQMQIRARDRAARVQEVEVRRLPRRAGSSKVSGSFWMALRVGSRMGYTLLRERWMRIRRQQGP